MPSWMCLDMWRHVYRDFSDLSKSEQLALFEVM